MNCRLKPQELVPGSRSRGRSCHRFLKQGFLHQSRGFVEVQVQEQALAQVGAQGVAQVGAQGRQRLKGYQAPPSQLV